MADPDELDRVNGVHVEVKKAENSEHPRHAHRRGDETLTFPAVVYRAVSTVFFPDFSSAASGEPFLRRIKISLSENVHLLREASANSARQLLVWTRRGSPLRALLVISIGTIVLLALTGLLVFMLFFLAATINAIVICLLMSLAAVGGFLALFLACLTAIYVGALAVAVFVISTATFSAIIAVLVATGWIGFFWTIWLATKKSVDLAKQSLTVTGSALSAYSAGRHIRHHKRSD